MFPVVRSILNGRSGSRFAIRAWRGSAPVSGSGIQAVDSRASTPGDAALIAASFLMHSIHLVRGIAPLFRKRHVCALRERITELACHRLAVLGSGQELRYSLFRHRSPAIRPARPGRPVSRIANVLPQGQFRWHSGKLRRGDPHRERPRPQDCPLGRARRVHSVAVRRELFVSESGRHRIA
jgi:hypothetical protein